MVDATVLPQGGANTPGEGEKTLQPLLDQWKVTVDKLDELQQWLVKALEEVKGARPNDPRWKVYREVEAAAERLDKELEDIERLQEEALTTYLEGSGPVTLALEDGARRILSASPRTAGGPADILPSELLRVWRVATVFQGSVALGDTGRLTFGDAAQIAATKPKKKGRR